MFAPAACRERCRRFFLLFRFGVFDPFKKSKRCFTLPKFSEWQQLYAKRTMWDDDQWERRCNHKVLLPDAHSKEDLLRIARALHPSGGKSAWALLAGCARADTKRGASAITETLVSALDIAQQDGRESVTYDDIDAAMRLEFRPIDKPGGAIKRPAATPDRSRTDCQFLLPKVDAARRSAHPVNRLQTADSA